MQILTVFGSIEDSGVLRTLDRRCFLIAEPQNYKHNKLMWWNIKKCNNYNNYYVICRALEI